MRATKVTPLRRRLNAQQNTASEQERKRDSLERKSPERATYKLPQTLKLAQSANLIELSADAAASMIGCRCSCRPLEPTRWLSGRQIGSGPLMSQLRAASVAWVARATLRRLSSSSVSPVCQLGEKRAFRVFRRRRRRVCKKTCERAS